MEPRTMRKGENVYRETGRKFNVLESKSLSQSGDRHAAKRLFLQRPEEAESFKAGLHISVELRQSQL